MSKFEEYFVTGLLPTVCVVLLAVVIVFIWSIPLFAIFIICMLAGIVIIAGVGYLLCYRRDKKWKA